MQASQQRTVCWLCPRCGEVTKYYLNGQGVQQRKKISIKPILPVCARCGSEVRIQCSPACRPDTRMIVLTGTCGSGKSSTAEELIARHGFDGIDGNCVIDVVKHRRGVGGFAFNGAEVLQEIALEIDILLALQKDIVLSHVIIPDDLPAYRETFRSRGLSYIIFVLQPQYSVAVSRTKERDVFPSPTAEEWVKHFHDVMQAVQPEDDVVVFDNSELSVEASAERILQLYSQRACLGSRADPR